jgi:hypothetical protein
MRKIISLGLFALILSIFSSQVFAGKVPFCEVEKDELKSKGLYGLCNAYWNNVDDENASAQILANFVKKAGTTLDDPRMPGWKPDGLVEVTCPCWDFDTLVQYVACTSLPLANYYVDITDDQSEFNLAWFDNDSIAVLVWAGDMPLDFNSLNVCDINLPMGEGKVLSKATSADEDAACRLDVLDVLDLFAEPLLDLECVL